MIYISFRKLLIFGIILTLVFTSLSPSIVGVKEDNHNTIEIDNFSDTPIISNKNIVSIPEIGDPFDFSISKEKYNLNPINKIREFFDLELMYPTLKTGLWDYTIKGFVTDASTNEPIENAHISFFWIGKLLFYSHDETFSNSNGFYEKSLEKIYAGLIWFLVSADGYYTYDRTIYEIYEDENDLDIWINVSLIPGAPSKNSKVCGYVLNADNGVPIEGADVIVIWEDYEDHNDWQYTFSDSTGYYSFDVAPGIVLSGVYKDSFYPKGRPGKEIVEGETICFNHYLYPREPEKATICGYVKDEITGNPIEDVLVILDLFNFEEWYPFDFNYTVTDSSGYYEMATVLGEIGLDFYTPVHSQTWGAQIEIEDYKTYWWNDTLYKIPPGTATICGNITNEITHKPINNAHVNIHWYDEEHHYFSWSKDTEESGFYKFDIPPGVIAISTSASYYFYFNSNDFEIKDNETIWFDIMLEPTPPELSMVHGYITGNKIGRQIIGDTLVKNARVYLFWEDDLGRMKHNYTDTDANGYYKMNVAAGKIHLWVTTFSYEYHDASSQEYTIEDYETIKIDVTLETEKHNIDILKPKGGIYLNNKKVFPFFVPIIFGNIDIEVNVSEYVYEVEFYIDGKFKHADRFDHGYTWDKLSFGKHEITVVGNGHPGDPVIKNIWVWKFF